MNINDRFFSLHHYIGKVKYEEIDDLYNYYSDPCWEKHLDSQGQGAALALMRLQEDLSYEQEVRLVYQYNPNDNKWVADNVRQYNNLCEVPINWDLAIENIIYSKNTNANELTKLLNDNKITCPISPSLIF